MRAARSIGEAADQVIGRLAGRTLEQELAALAHARRTLLAAVPAARRRAEAPRAQAEPGQ